MMRYLLRLLLTIFAGVLYIVGWILGKGAVFVAWVWSAAAVGWDDARGTAVQVDAPLRRVA